MSESEIQYLAYPGHVITDRPVRSMDYGNCVGTVLIGTGVHHAVTHYSLPRSCEEVVRQYAEDTEAVRNFALSLLAKLLTPEEYIPRLQMELHEDILGCVQFGGDEEHMERVRTICTQQKIPLLAEVKRDSLKHLFYNPNTKEIFLKQPDIGQTLYWRYGQQGFIGIPNA